MSELPGPRPQDTYDAVVVGSGPNGLCAAIRLQQAGRSVLILEAAEGPGGGARTAQLTLPGFHHDVCSAIHPMAVGSPFLGTLPLTDHGLEWVHPTAPAAHPFDDRPAAILHRSVSETADGLGADAHAYRAWMAPLTDNWAALAADGLAPLGVPKSPLLMARFGMQAMVPATVLARQILASERGRGLFAGLAGHAVLPLERPPSAAIAMMLQIAAHAVGWPMPRGGAGALSGALVSYFRSIGGTLQCGARVDHLDQVPTRGPVLFETGPHALAEICGDALPSDYRRRLRAYRYGPGVFKVDFALNAPIPWADPAVAMGGTVHLGGSLDEIAASERDAWRGVLSERPYCLVAQQSLFDDRRAPPGFHTGWAYCHVPAGSPVNHTEAIERQIERFAPGFRDTIVARHTMNAQQFQAYNANYVGGDVNGGAPTLGQLFTRPVARANPYTTPNPRVFLCSASTPPGGGIHGMCGFYAAEAALRAG